jgi:hypothetical protein
VGRYLLFYHRVWENDEGTIQTEMDVNAAEHIERDWVREDKMKKWELSDGGVVEAEMKVEVDESVF